MKKVPLETVLAEQPRNGWSPPAEYQTGSGVPVLTLSAVTGFNYDGSKVKLTSVPTNVGAHYWLREGELLITRSNTEELVGHVAIYDGTPVRAICCDLIMKMRVDPSKALTRYVYYFLRTPEARRYFSSRAQGASPTMKKIGKQVVQNTPLPLPSLTEQQRIVGVLDEAFEGLATAKANAEKNLQNARALFESHLQSVFTQRGPGWVEKPLYELCHIKHGYAFDGAFFTNEGDYVLLTPGNFYESGGYRDRGEKQKYYVGEIPRDYVLNQGDLLVAMTEQAAGLLGSPILVPESNRFLHNQRLGLVIAKPGVPWVNAFFFHVFNLQTVRKLIHDSASGTKVRHTSPTKIGLVEFAFPNTIAEQQRIVRELDALSAETQRLAALYERKVAALEELKKSLLHQAFSGEL